MFLMAFYAMHKPKNEVEKMKHKKKFRTSPNQWTDNLLFKCYICQRGLFFSHLILIATLKVVNPTI